MKAASQLHSFHTSGREHVDALLALSALTRAACISTVADIRAFVPDISSRVRALTAMPALANYFDPEGDDDDLRRQLGQFADEMTVLLEQMVALCPPIAALLEARSVEQSAFEQSVRRATEPMLGLPYHPVATAEEIADTRRIARHLAAHITGDGQATEADAANETLRIAGAREARAAKRTGDQAA